MIEKSLAQPTRTSTGEDARKSRGIAIATNRMHDIRKISPGCYAVPASKNTECYVVTVWPSSQCNCPDKQLRLEAGEACKHIHAVRYLTKKTFVCDGCGERFWNEDYHQVEESLAYFEGDELCEVCFLSAACS